jgi:hypothetical protein
MSQSGFLFLLGIGAATAVGVGAGRYARSEPPAPAVVRTEPRAERLGGYRLVRPLLECGAGTASRRLDLLRPQLEAAAARADARVSVHVRDLESGETLDVAPGERFDPADLTRVAALMAALKAAEAGGPPLPGALGPLDAEGAAVVDASVTAAAVRRTFAALGAGAPDSASARDIGALFACLYDATYLGPGDSERAVEALARTRARDGIAAGAPFSVAHLGSERTTPDGDRERHDCGIVHAPGRPYVLCVMTHGAAGADLEGAIRAVAATVHTYYGHDAGRAMAGAK